MFQACQQAKIGFTKKGFYDKFRPRIFPLLGSLA
jgi:hypothetical protein